MRWTAKAIGSGLVMWSLGAGGAAVPAQQTAAPVQNVPDAPKPQTLPSINTITPTAPAIPNAPVPNAAPVQPGANGSANGEFVPGPTLPSTKPAPVPADEDGGAGPSTPGDTAGSPARHAADIVVFSNFVEVPFTVKDSKGSLVPGITYRDVRVYENGQLQSPRLFTVDPTPLSVALVIDQSVTFDTMAKVNASLEALQSAFTPYDEIAIFTYNNGVTEQTGFTGAQSQRVAFALQRSKSEGRDATSIGVGPLEQTTVKNNLPVDPQTNRNSPAGALIQNVPREFHTLNDAILKAAVQVAKAGRGRRRVIFVISDGKEYGSEAKEKQVIQFLQTNGIAVYATLVGDSSIPGVDFLDRFHIPLQLKDNVLPRYVSATGGDYNAAFRPRAIENSFAKLSEEVRTQYAVGYYSHEPFIDGKFRPYEVRVLRPNLNVIAPKGYFPNAQAAVQGTPGVRRTDDTAPATPAPATGSNSPTTP